MDSRNREGMGISRKFSKGTVHENATGKFTIMDRFKENNIIYLEFQWLSGEKAGEVEINKEGNMNASIHKFNSSRGITPAIQYTEKVEPFVEKIEELYESLPMFKESNALLREHNAYLKKFDVQLDQLTDIVEKQQELIHTLTIQLQNAMDKSESVERQQKLTEKIIDTLGGNK